MSFIEIFERLDWEEIKISILNKTRNDVEAALSKTEARSLEDFKALISPAASPYIEQMAALSHEITKKRFGNTMQMFIPLYLSNECHNICTYCGFSLGNKVKRKTLSDSEILSEVKALKDLGFDHVLIVTGEDQTNVGMEYFKNALKLIQPHFSHISMEVQPLDTVEY